MAGTWKAPILHHFSESIVGASTIHCFNQEQLFLIKVKALIDDYSQVAFYNFGSLEWLSVRINFLFNMVLYFVLVPSSLLCQGLPFKIAGLNQSGQRREKLNFITFIYRMTLLLLWSSKMLLVSSQDREWKIYAGASPLSSGGPLWTMYTYWWCWYFQDWSASFEM